MQKVLRQDTPGKLGVLVLGRKRPGFDQEWNEIMRRKSLSALEALGFSCVGADAPVVDDETLHTRLEEIRASRAEALLILQPSIGNGQLAFTVAQQWSDPLVLWATPERPQDGKVSSCSLVGQHLWASVLRQADHPFEFAYGDPEDAGLRAELTRALALCRTYRFLRHAKVGVIGTHVPGFIDLAADPFLLRRAIGIQLHPLSLVQYLERVRAVPEQAVHKDMEKVRALRLQSVNVNDESYEINSRVYLAMVELMEEESLQSLAIQCWPEIPNLLGQWPYLAVSRLGSEGHSVAIEGDVDGSIGSLMGASLGMGPGFLTDWLEHDASTIFFWHPGMAPLDMCHSLGTPKGPSLGAHFNVVKPFVVDGQLRAGEEITVSRLWRCDGRYHLAAFEGRSIEPRRSVTGNSTLVEFAGRDVPKTFDQLIHAGMPHHVLLHFGRHADTFRRLARMLDVDWHD